MPAIHLPPGYGAAAPTAGEPQTQAVVMETADGRKVAYPLVACAVVSPEVVKAIAAEVFYLFNPEARPQEEAPNEISDLGETTTA